MTSFEIKSDPDHPIGFGRKCLWLAARAADSRSLADTLGLLETQPANWQSGFQAAYAYPSDYIFVTPPLDGWVLAVGAFPDPSDPAALPGWRNLMAKVSRRYGAAQFFGSHRVSNYTVWAHYRDGVETRLFAHGDELIYNLGEPLPEEAHLIAHLPDPSSPAAQEQGYWERDDLRIPDEEDVLHLAGLWSVDPSELDLQDRPASAGLVGRLIQAMEEDSDTNK